MRGRPITGAFCDTALLPSAGRLAFVDSVTILVALGGQVQFLIVLVELATMVLFFLQASGKLDDWLTRAG